MYGAVGTVELERFLSTSRRRQHVFYWPRALHATNDFFGVVDHRLSAPYDSGHVVADDLIQAVAGRREALQQLPAVIEHGRDGRIELFYQDLDLGQIALHIPEDRIQSLRYLIGNTARVRRK